MKKSNSHTFTISIRFDRPCTRALALREIRDNIYGNFYPTVREEGEPEEAWIKSIRPLPKILDRELHLTRQRKTKKTRKT